MVGKRDFVRIAVTPDYFYPDEAEAIECLLAGGGFDYVHIRKPCATSESIMELVSAIAPRWRDALTLHDHLDIASHTGVGGVHLNRRFPTVPDGWVGRVSRSCHTVEECLESAAEYDYVTLSPIYPSLSKPGYRPCFDPETLNTLLHPGHQGRILALGGVTRAREPALLASGFDGTAMLSDAWRHRFTPLHFALQLVTHPGCVDQAVQQADQALSGGCRWIQLRWKDADDSLFKEAAILIAASCRSYGAVMMLDDRVHLVRACGADGVHLGKNDMPVSEARRFLGPSCIIGATANTPEDIRAAAIAGADYIGYGPFRFTTTKKNLSPVLGLAGYRRAVDYCRDKSIDIPVVAIGGITESDAPALMHTGINGLAVSRSINDAPHPAAATASLVSLIKKHQKNGQTYYRRT